MSSKYDKHIWPVDINHQVKHYSVLLLRNWYVANQATLHMCNFNFVFIWTSGQIRSYGLV